MLPQKIILKKKDDSCASRFETERRFYENVKELQERGLVPQYHGLVSIGDSPALVLSDLGGTTLLHRPSLSLDENALRGNLRELLEAIRRAGVVHEDISLLNVLHCEDGRLRLIDFEMALIDQPYDEEELKMDLDMEIDGLVKFLKLRQEAQEERKARYKRDAPIHEWNTLGHNHSTAAPGMDYGSALC